MKVYTKVVYDKDDNITTTMALYPKPGKNQFSKKASKTQRNLSKKKLTV